MLIAIWLPEFLTVAALWSWCHYDISKRLYLLTQSQKNWISSDICVRNSDLANVLLRLKLWRWQPGQSWESSVGFEDVIPRILVCPLSYFAHLCHRTGQLREMNCLTANTWACVCLCVLPGIWGGRIRMYPLLWYIMHKCTGHASFPGKMKC
jgi:hypothetical protein